MTGHAMTLLTVFLLALVLIGGGVLFMAVGVIFRRMNAICVASGRFFGQTSWQASSDMQPNTPSSSPITS
jgi:hypothetical protein